jgi:hypothetical protein
MVARLTPEMVRTQMLAYLGQANCSAGAADLQQIAAVAELIAPFAPSKPLKSARPGRVEPPTFGFEEREH